MRHSTYLRMPGRERARRSPPGSPAECGQAMVLTAFLLLGLAVFGLFLLVNALYWFNSAAATRQALVRAARDGATEMVLEDGLALTEVINPTAPLPSLTSSRHCLDPVRAEATARASLARNLAYASSLYVEDDGSPLTPAEIASDTTGTYLVELNVVNPAALGCPHSDPLPTYPPGASYNFTRPFVHITVRAPMKALFGGFRVNPTYAVDVTSAIDPTGG